MPADPRPGPLVAGVTSGSGTDGAQAGDPPDVVRVAVIFARVLRECGLGVDSTRILSFVEALDAVGLGDRDTVYWAGRVTFCARPDDFPRYDRAWAALFGAGTGAEGVETKLTAEILLAVDTEDSESGQEDQVESADHVVTLRWSSQEILREKHFDEYTEHEFEELRRLAAGLQISGSAKRSRRLVPARRGGHMDVRRTLRQAMRHGGEPADLRFLAHSERPRRLVLLCDVSGSMESHARALLRFMHAAVSGYGGGGGIAHGKVEAFAIGTRCTRLTRELRSRDPDAAIQAATEVVADWGGGTRLGETLRTFLDEWGQRGMARGADVVVLSDGWDRGDPEFLAAQMARLHRLAHRVVWVNPLKASPGYAPLAQGMAAALPHVDEFLEGHAWISLEKLAEVVSG